MIKKALPIAVIILLALALTNCNNNGDEIKVVPDAKAIEKDETIPGNFSTQTKLTFDSSLMNAFLDSFPLFTSFQKEMDSFYYKRNFAYAWFDEKGMIEPAANLYNRIQNISDEGIPGKLPYKEAFSLIMEADIPHTKPAPFTELMLTAQYLVYAKNVWEGLSEEQSLSVDWLLPRKKTSYSELLDSLSTGILENEPVYRQYSLLREQLKKYRSIKTNNGWQNIGMNNKNYVTGDSSLSILQIRERLFLLGDLPANNKSSFFDQELEIGIRNFQRRYGFKDNGKLTSTLIKELNFPIDKRIEQIMVNMERSRWVPVQLSDHYLVVNIPEYKLHVYEADSIAWSMNVVVGKDQHKTVVFNGDLKYIVFSPYWNVPSSILKNEILPAIKRNRNYLAQHNMEWHNGSVRQKPGINNSLGLVKFLFPNSHNIYLHDTPSKSLFKEDNRAFSHGCIRLSQPQKLAAYLLRNDTTWTAEKITNAMNSGKEKYVTLKKTVPVFIAYFTAWVDSNGNLNFRKDIYQRDSRLAQMILENSAI